MLVLIGILTFISILIQSHCLYSQFMIDDFNYINLTPHWSNYTDVFIKPTGYHYNPLNFSLNTFLYQVTTNPFTLKLINFILFTLNGFGVFIIITQLTEHKRIGFLASLLFLVHPINAEMLAHITYNNGIFLSTNLLFFSLWAFLKTAQNKPVSKHQSWLSYLFYFASLLFSEIYLIFPLLLIIYLLTNQYKNNLLWDSVKKYILITLCYLLIWLYLLNPLNSYSTKINHINLNVVEYGIGIAQLINWYITNLFFPTDIVFMKSIARADIQFSPGLLWIFIAILTVWLWIWKLKQRPLKVTFLWFFAGLIILFPDSLSHVYSMGIVIEPYWFYFTEIGFFSFCAIVLYELKNHIQRILWVLLVGAISLH